MKINIVLPFMSKRAVGGIKILYQYADFLSDKGHTVILYHAEVLHNAPRKILNPFRLIRNRLFNRGTGPTWFYFNNEVESRCIKNISNDTIEDGDVLISTMYATALDVYVLDKSKGKKINVIQDYETWITEAENLEKSYRLPITHIVINDYLYDLVQKHSPTPPVLVYNAIDTSAFEVVSPIENRDQHSICMMYSEEKRKGTVYGIATIERCKKEFPDLKTTFFSVFPRPKGLPEWIDFVQSPKKLSKIYNAHAIFFTPSIGEGWALPPAEAMCCGCAVVCTDIGGHAAYAKDNKTALLVESKNVDDMTEKLTNILKDREQRVTIARQGSRYIQQFTWDSTIDKLEKCF